MVDQITAKQLEGLIEALSAIFAAAVREVFKDEIKDETMTEYRAEVLLGAIGDRYYAALKEVEDRVNAKIKEDAEPKLLTFRPAEDALRDQ